MELKDYLKYYIGCEMLCTDKQNDECICGSERHTISWVNLSPETDNKNWVLLLRPLSNITHKEVCELARISFKIFPDTYVFKADLNEPKRAVKYGSGCRVDIFDNVGTYIDSVVQSWAQLNAEQFHYLLSKSFDLFDLIKNGSAINKTTITL